MKQVERQDQESSNIKDAIIKLLAYLELTELDKTKQAEFDQLLGNFVQWIEAGKLKSENIKELLGTPWYQAQHDGLLMLLLAVDKRFDGSEEIKSLVKSRFLEIAQSKESVHKGILMLVMQCTNAVVERSSLENLISEVCKFEAFICTEQYRALIEPVILDAFKLSVSYQKDILYKRLGQDTRYLMEGITSQLKNIVESPDLQYFSKWMTEISMLLLANLMGDAESMLRLILSKIESPRLLYQASITMSQTRERLQKHHMKMYLLRQSLAIMRVALRKMTVNRLQEVEEFELLLKEFMDAVQKNREHALAEIDQLVTELFQPDVHELRSERIFHAAFNQDLLRLEPTCEGLAFRFLRVPEKHSNVRLVAPEGASVAYLSDAAIKALSTLTEVKALSIGHIHGPNERNIFEVFGAMAKLRCLKLDEVFTKSFSEFNEQGLSLCKHLEELEIASHCEVNYRGDFFETLGAAARVVKLKRMAFTGTKLSNNGFDIKK